MCPRNPWSQCFHQSNRRRLRKGPSLKIYACYSDSHIPFLSKHFLLSLPTDMQAVLVHIPQDCTTGSYRDPLWGSMAERKLRMVQTAIKNSDEDDPFFISDVDARFYGPLDEDLRACLGKSTIAAQNDGPGGMCSGCFVARPSADLYDAIDLAIKLLPEHSGHDQPAFNVALDEIGIIPITLPDRYWSHGATAGVLWTPGMTVTPPTDLIVHQANWCIGIENKLALLETVRAAKDNP